MKIIRHGDVVLMEVSQGMENVMENKYARHVEGEELILAEGEVTGHHHRLTTHDGDVLINSWRGAAMVKKDHVSVSTYRPFGERDKSGQDNTIVFRLMTGAKLSHEEHDPIDVPAGDWVVINQREAWGGEKKARRVYD